MKDNKTPKVVGHKNGVGSAALNSSARPARVNFGKLEDVLEIPDMIGIQLESYETFLQKDVKPEDRKNQGLQAVFNEIFPIQSFDKQCSLEFKSYRIDKPAHSIIDCLKDGFTYDAPLKVKLLFRQGDTTTEEDVSFDTIPLMTPNGSFIINGAERVIISQIHRSPGICFEKRKHSTGRELYSYRIIPDRGSWLEVVFDIKNNIYIFLDRKKKRKKFLITTFLRAIGYETNEDIVKAIYEVKEMTPAKLLKEGDNIYDYYTFDPITDENGYVVINPYVKMTDAHVRTLQENRIKSVKLAYIPRSAPGASDKDALIRCLEQDPTTDTESAIKRIFNQLRPGEPTNMKVARQLVENICFNERRYDIGAVGRFKINQHLGLNVDENIRVLTPEDVVAATRRLIDLSHTNGETDDIDHLGARRVRSVGELLQNQCRVGLLRTDRMVRERLIQCSSQTDKPTKPADLVNTKIFHSCVRDYFARSQLSQFMDQTNPLSEMTNKRRLSALGPGGLSRERAGFEVRDIHSSHYGRICPIETPEGPNIGLISSVSLYAKVNKYGFLETPYRKVIDGVVTNEIVYLSADLEENYVIAQANAPLDKNHRFINPTVMSRYKGDSGEHPKETVQLMDVSPKQLVSGSAGLIPFLEHDDANRALMGSNMQRQAVPLMVTESPYVGTGLERKIAVDSRAVVSSQTNGIVAEVCNAQVVVTTDGLPREKTSDPNPMVYDLLKFLRSNAGTCVNQKPIVRSGDVVKIGDPIADGAATDGAELSLGKNVRAAYMPWCGYNFEDAIVLSERLVKEDIYTSIHVDEFEVMARDTKLGAEEITADLPNVPEEMLRNLDANGIIRPGTEVKPGDILVGKLTPKMEQELAPEERLLRAIFGDKAQDMKDSSLTLPSGKGGIVMDVRIERLNDSTTDSKSKTSIKQKQKDAKDTFNRTKTDIAIALQGDLQFLNGQKLPSNIYTYVEDKKTGEKVEEILVNANRKVTDPSIIKLSKALDNWHMHESCAIEREIRAVFERHQFRFNEAKRVYEEAMKATSPNYIANGRIHKVKVYIASKRKIQVGDKMAGRHGNKGIVSRIVPIEDMPFTSDGRPVDIVLNPLGVPSRMNIGQILEAHLGLAASMLGIKAATPVFDGVPEEKIVDMLREANKKQEAECGENFHWGFRMEKDANGNEVEVFDGKTDVFDGRTGNKFDQRITVGVVYMLKLDHLVANKIHARSTGPYSLVTQQPLGGKAQHGGQRFGEMEVWALEAYGAANTLQEMLTVKSDDTVGRNRIYESIVQGKNIFQPGRPESFNVLLKEMQSLCLDVRAVKRTDSGNN